jgi:sRNA-binding protein
MILDQQDSEILKLSVLDEKKERNEMKAQQKAERKAQKKAEREKLAKEKAERRAEQRAKHPPILFQPKPPLPIMKSEYPESIKCPHCRVDVTTRVTRRVGNGTLLISSGNFMKLN